MRRASPLSATSASRPGEPADAVCAMCRRSAATSAAVHPHVSMATGQRGWNRQPGGMSDGSGRSPFRMIRWRRRSGSGTGTTEMSAFVYGCCAFRITSRVGPSSTIRPRYITATRSASRQASSGSWLTKRAAAPVSCESARISMRSRSRMSTSRLDSASSNRSRSGSAASARATRRQLSSIVRSPAPRASR